MKKCLFFTVSLLGMLNSVTAQFQQTDIVVLQIGNGTETLVNTGNTLLLRAFSPAGIAGTTVTLPNE